MKSRPMNSLPFHIHVDAMTLSSEFEKQLIEHLGFWRSDFAGHPEGAEAYIPNRHFTHKVQTTAEFRRVFDAVEAAASVSGAMEGYIEGEYVARDDKLPEKAFDASVPIPFRISTVRLPPEKFREDEIHVTLNRAKSDPRLFQHFSEMGFFPAYIPKPYGIAEIFTVQGSVEKIARLLPSVLEYVTAAGGAADCSVKEERVARFWMSRPDVRRAPVIDTIAWNKPPCSAD